MPRDYNDDDDDRMGGFGQGHSSFGGTSSFNTTGLSDDGRFLGMKLSAGLASDFRRFYPVVLEWARVKGQHIGVPLAEKFAKNVLKKTSEKDIQRFGSRTGNVIGYSIVLSNQILDIGRNIYDSTQSLNDLRIAVKPLAKSGASEGGVMPLSGDNEVVVNARKKINGIFWQRLLQTATGAIAVAPSLMFQWNEQKAKNLRLNKAQELDRAIGDPEAIADLYDKELSAGGTKVSGTPEQLRKGKEHWIERHRAQYKTAMESSITGEFDHAKKEITELLQGLNPNNIEVGIEKLQAHGFDVRSLNSYVHEVTGTSTPGKEANKKIQDLIDRHRTSWMNNIDYHTDRALRVQYVQKHGAFDDADKKYSLSADGEYDEDGRYHRKLTKKEELERELQKRQEDLRKLDEENRKGDGKGSEAAKMAATLASGIGAEFMTQRLIGSAAQKYQKPMALDRILHLRLVLEQSGDNVPDQIPGIQFEQNRNEKDTSYVEYVHNIFQQHQRDSGRAAIGDRFFEHFENARFDDAAIQQLPDEQLTAYEYAVKTIAKRIKDGRMDAIALVNLVGDKNKKLVKSDGRFGPKGASKDDAKVKEAILHVIDEQTALAHAGHKKSDGDINEKLGNFIFSLDDMKNAMQDGVLDKQERAFLFTILSDAIGNDEELGKKLGLSDARRRELRKEAKDEYNAVLDGAVLVMAEQLQADPNLAKELKFSGKEKEIILSLAERIQQEGKDVADLTADRQELKTLETVVANSLIKGKDGLWAKVVEKAKGVPEIIAEAKKRREEQPSAEEPTSLMDRANREEPLVPGGRGA
jgi:hypothetical protein